MLKLDYTVSQIEIQLDKIMEIYLFAKKKTGRLYLMKIELLLFFP
jgi:hypothetical protein